MTDLLTLKNLTLGYQRHPAVHHLSGTVRRGEVLAVVGPNGAGKSTLLKALGSQIAPLSGDLLNQADKIVYLPQLIDFQPGFPIRADDFVGLGLPIPRWPFGATRQLRAKAAAAMAQVGLAGLEDRPLATLSGGQLQRVRFARLIATDAALVLLDEPLAGLDDLMVETIVEIIRGWRSAGKTVVLVLHELDVVRAVADRVLLLAREPIAWDRPEIALSPQNLERAAQLRQSWNDHAAVCARGEAA
jgi:zinc/manganese transport system ATP-binding protein